MERHPTGMNEYATRIMHGKVSTTPLGFCCRIGWSSIYMRNGLDVIGIISDGRRRDIQFECCTSVECAQRRFMCSERYEFMCTAAQTRCAPAETAAVCPVEAPQSTMPPEALRYSNSNLMMWMLSPWCYPDSACYLNAHLNLPPRQSANCLSTNATQIQLQVTASANNCQLRILLVTIGHLCRMSAPARSLLTQSKQR